ncbi:uncharacterized protein LOC100377670, partial [Saccoglossus kowalevskii]|uniref:Uncharacterized protein LOC100377670 n=1 Tax=Saccoglossus kowalevskii TaxID=10224 RepID=A0ABM0GN18_SACKO
KSGLTENELEDLLSLDDDVLNDVYQYWTPPIRRLPPLLWVRIRAELSDYLVDRGADGVRVVYWYHRQFIEAANDRYMSDTNTTMNLHSNMADYFLGRWSKGVKKPYTNRKGEHCESDRLVAAQPLLFDAGTYNLRKLSEMPYHLLKCERWDTLKETVLCNLEWLYTKTKATSLKNVLEDFRTTRLKYANDKQINTIAEVIQLSQEALLHDPAQLASQLVARLPNTQGLEDILDQAKRSPALCFMPSHPFMTPPGGQLLHTLSGHRETISAFDVSSDGCLALTGDDFTNVKLWDVESGYLIKSVMEYTKNDGGSIKCVRFCDSDRVFAVSLNNIVKIFRTDTLAEVRIIEPYDDDETSGVPFAMAGSCKDKLVIPCHRKVVVYDITTGSRICRIIDAKLLREYFEETHIEARGNTIAYYNEHVEKHSNLLRIVDLSQDTPTPDTINVYPDVKTYEDGYEEITSIGALALTCDDEVIVSNMMDNDLKIYNTKSLELLRILKGTKSDFSQHFYITQDDRYLLFPNSSSDVCIWDLQTETKEYRLKHPNSVERVASLDYKRVVTVGGDNLVRVWDATRSDSVQYIVKRDWKFYRGQHEEHKSYTVSKAQSSAKTQNDKDDDNTDSFTDLWSIPGQKRYVLAQSQRNKQYSITIWDCATTKPVLRIQSRAGEGKGGGSKFHLTILNNNEALCFVNRKLKLLNYTNGKIVRVFKGQLAYSGSICIVNNHREVLTTTSHGRNLKLYDIQTGSVVTILKQSDEKTKDSKSVIDVKVKSDGKGTVAVSVLDEDEQKCYVWDIPKRSLKHIMKLPDTYSNEKGQVFDYNIDLTDSDISADETYICTIQSLHCEKSRIVAWNLKTGVFQCTLCNDGEGEPNTVKIIESNKVVVSYWDGLKEIWIWSILSAEILLKFPGHQNYEVDKLIISEDERRLLSYTPRSEEREFILWDIQTGNKIAGFTQEDNAEMVLVYGGDMVAVGCNSIGAIVTFNLQGPNVDKLDTGGHSFYKDVDNVIMVDLTEASDNNIDVDDVDSDEESEHDDDEDTDNFDDREMSDDEDDLNAGYIRNDLDTDDEK